MDFMRCVGFVSLFLLATHSPNAGSVENSNNCGVGDASIETIFLRGKTSPTAPVSIVSKPMNALIASSMTVGFEQKLALFDEVANSKAVANIAVLNTGDLSSFIPPSAKIFGVPKSPALAEIVSSSDKTSSIERAFTALNLANNSLFRTVGSDKIAEVSIEQRPGETVGSDAELMKAFIGAPDCTTYDLTQRLLNLPDEINATFGNNASRANDGWISYLSDPGVYVKKNLLGAQKFELKRALMIRLLKSCFRPAATAEVYQALNLSIRLGYLRTKAAHICEAFLLSRKYVVTAKHCWLGSSRAQIEPLYGDGQVYFESVGDRTRQFRVCAAQTKIKETSLFLQDLRSEQLVLRIEPVPYQISAIDTVASSDVIPVAEKPISSLDANSKAMAVFPRVIDSESINPQYQNNLAVGAPACYVQNFNRDKQCFTHMCLTYPGTSGGPIFMKARGKWKLLGIHLGAVDANDGTYPDCPLKHGNVENVGLVLISSELAKYSE